MRMFVASSPALRRSLPLALALALGPLACGGGDGGGGSALLAFDGQQDFLPGFDYDSGWLPEGSPVSIRATATASGGVTVHAQATADGDALMPVAGSGTLAVEGALALEVSARIDTMGIEYEGVVETFAYAIDPVMQGFEPFAIDTAVPATATLPAAELGRVPIPSVPGASLVLAIEGGELSTVFTGVCATAAGGLAQYTGSLNTSGTIDAAATVEIEVPIVGTQSFGPFAFQVPIPASDHAVDLGTLTLPSGEATDAAGPCNGVGAGTDADTGGGDGSGGNTSTASTASTTNATGTDASGGLDTSGGGETGTTDAGEASQGSSDAGSPDGDPNYPAIGDGCPSGSVGIGIDTDIENNVCAPPCDGSGVCPDGATGDAVPVCAFNPDSTYDPCSGDGECSGGESCAGGLCELAPTHCVLACDDTTTCPDTMACLLGFCTVPV
ncbi:MAG: hypothetical protein IPH07_19425 [Deltaproteobacteria bacterium]|nr:hypothetical protein [Deltaproteobacteria bacterium]MBP7286606.1 hypothetical protein [Nannocystaceae bacterium]